MWAGLGYYRRARYLLEGAKYVMEHHNGAFPKTSKDLQKIPGQPRQAPPVLWSSGEQPSVLLARSYMKLPNFTITSKQFECLWGCRSGSIHRKRHRLHCMLRGSCSGGRECCAGDCAPEAHGRRPTCGCQGACSPGRCSARSSAAWLLQPGGELLISCPGITLYCCISNTLIILHIGCKETILLVQATTTFLDNNEFLTHDTYSTRLLYSVRP